MLIFDCSNKKKKKNNQNDETKMVVCEKSLWNVISDSTCISLFFYMFINVFNPLILNFDFFFFVFIWVVSSSASITFTVFYLFAWYFIVNLTLIFSSQVKANRNVWKKNENKFFFWLGVDTVAETNEFGEKLDYVEFEKSPTTIIQHLCYTKWEKL